MSKLTVDYLVVGAGGMGMAFVDELLTHNQQVTVALVDRYEGPGGHWLCAYPYVSLHQPAAFYGVNSEPLGTGGMTLASGKEVVSYFQRVVNKHIGGGRLKYFPQCQYHFGDSSTHRFTSNLSGDVYEIEVARKFVDATYMKVEVPAMREPPFPVAVDCQVIPPNGLATITSPFQRYVVIGSGKTGMDAVLLLLGRGVAADQIVWICPNDAWLLDRANIFPSGLLRTLIQEQELFASADDLESLLLKLEGRGLLLRLDPSVWATKYRCATVSQEELVALRTIRNIIRQGRVLEVRSDKILLEQGELAIDHQVVMVDCTANGLAHRPPVPVFACDRITLQSVLMCQQVFSAALIGHVETAFTTDQRKNELCQSVPHPETIDDYLYASRVNMANNAQWSGAILKWLRKSRLSFMSHISAWQLLINARALQKHVVQAATNLDSIATLRAGGPEQ